MSIESYPRPKIQCKDGRQDVELLSLLTTYDIIVFYSLDTNGSIAAPSQRVLALLDAYEVRAARIEATHGSPLEAALQSFSGWQYFPQVYVSGEFIGGSLVVEEFIRSGEHERILMSKGVRDQFQAKANFLAELPIWNQFGE